jgi:ribonuclease BN (tRNA processing enzyme)
MQIIFLGTNGWFDSPTGSTICTLINTESCHIILDAGNGIYKADRYIQDDLPVYIFLSHFHLDHIEGLHVLNKFSFPRLSSASRALRSASRPSSTSPTPSPWAGCPIPSPSATFCPAITVCPSR